MHHVHEIRTFRFLLLLDILVVILFHLAFSRCTGTIQVGFKFIVRHDIGQPIKRLVKTFTGSCGNGENAPMSVPQKCIGHYPPGNFLP